MERCDGVLLDGTSTSGKDVVLELSGLSLLLMTADNRSWAWNYRDLAVEKDVVGYRCTLKKIPTGAPAAPIVTFTSPQLYKDLSGKVLATRHPVSRFVAVFKVLNIWQLAVLVIAVLTAFVWFFIQMLLQAYTVTPYRYDTRLGGKVSASIERLYEECTTPHLDTFFDKAMTTLAQPDDKFAHRVKVLNYPVENAISIPGGTIYVFRGLLEKSQSPDAVLGVLAHEIAHAERRHSVRQVIHSMGIYYMGTLLIGMAIEGMDLLEQLESLLEMSSLLFSLRYSRKFEMEADSLGIIRLHQAGLKVGPLDSLLTSLTPKPRARDRVFQLFSTHPLQEARSARFSVARYEEQGFAPDTVFEFERSHWDSILEGCPEIPKKVPVWKRVIH